MKNLTLLFILTILLSTNAFSQKNFPVKFRVEKQAMSTPMTDIDDIFFGNSYYSRPVNINFDGTLLNMYYDNGATLIKKNLTQINKESDFEDGFLAMETYIYNDPENPEETILFVIDYNVGYLQVVLPTKNSKGEYIGYTSYREFVDQQELASK